MGRTTIRSGQIKDDNIQIVDLSDFAVVTGTDLNVTVQQGRIRNDNVITNVAAHSLAVSDNATNYIELDTTGTSYKNTIGFTSGRIPLATVVTASGAITVINDVRTWISIPAVASADPIYLGGSPTTDGTWKISVSGAFLIFERRESGVYVQKGTMPSVPFFDTSWGW